MTAARPNSSTGSSCLCGMSVPMPVTWAPARTWSADSTGEVAAVVVTTMSAPAASDVGRTARREALVGQPFGEPAGLGLVAAVDQDGRDRAQAGQPRHLQLGLLAGPEDADHRSVRAGHRVRRQRARGCRPPGGQPALVGQHRAHLPGHRAQDHHQTVVGRQPALGVAIGAGGDLDREVVGALDPAGFDVAVGGSVREGQMDRRRHRRAAFRVRDQRGADGGQDVVRVHGPLDVGQLDDRRLIRAPGATTRRRPARVAGRAARPRPGNGPAGWG